SRTSPKPVRWHDHIDDVVGHAQRAVQKLPLRDQVRQAVILAARFHDLGKTREVWQRGIGNPCPTEWLAKSGKGMTPRDICPDYRHEFGSLLDVLDATQGYKAQVDQLDGEMQDLVLHLIAAHHGRARPHFPQAEALDPEHKHEVVIELMADIPGRFARLQRKYGRWGLAYLESLLRSADWAASAKPSAFAEPWPPEQEKPT
ncbi:MAG: CRISPR-associated endonuclease Cas3'', partial [Patescibacteria group bacterium]|nr:CRISPR-associated endonuclease Cas3'' [Patescibacteria group bacterium]